VLLCPKIKTEPASKTSHIFKKLKDGQSKKKKTQLSSVTLFSTDDDLGVQALIWLCGVQFHTSCASLRPPHIFKQQIYGENPRLAFE